MRIAILGPRGVPPTYGGFETLAAELGTRLVQRGHEVTVYCRSQVAGRRSRGHSGAAAPATRDQRPATWNGIHRIVLPFIPGKYFETVSHTFIAAFDALRRDF